MDRNTSCSSLNYGAERESCDRQAGKTEEDSRLPDPPSVDPDPQHFPPECAERG